MGEESTFLSVVFDWQCDHTPHTAGLHLRLDYKEYLSVEMCADGVVEANAFVIAD